MKPSLLFTLGLLSLSTLASAQATQQPVSGTIYVYMVAKQDAKNVVISEVMEASTPLEHADLVAMFQQEHPDVSTPHDMEGLRFATKAEAEKDRNKLKANYEKIGKTVTLLEGH